MKKWIIIQFKVVVIIIISITTPISVPQVKTNVFFTSSDTATARKNGVELNLQRYNVTQSLCHAHHVFLGKPFQIRHHSHQTFLQIAALNS